MTHTHTLSTPEPPRGPQRPYKAFALLTLTLVCLGLATTPRASGQVLNSSPDVEVVDRDTGESISIVSNRVQVSYENFLIEVAKGSVPGHTIINKFGHNPLVLSTGGDIWRGGGTYDFYPTNAQAVSAYSSSAADTVASTGAHNVIFYGLDSNWEAVSETVAMNGATPVELTNTYRRMYRGAVFDVGSAESNVGNIIVTNSAGTRAIYIAASDGQTQQCIYTIPANTTAMLLKGYVALGNDDKNGVDGTFQWQARPNNGFVGAWQTKGQVTLVNIGSSHWQYEYGGPAGMLPAKTDLRIRVTEADATIDGIGGLDLLLVEDGY